LITTRARAIPVVKAILVVVVAVAAQMAQAWVNKKVALASEN
jgi:hypothetical protein